MNAPLKRIAEVGIVPVINIEQPKYAVPLAQALCDGGIPVIEVTLRNESSLQSIEAIRSVFPDMAVAAGTVLSPAMADEAQSAGADLVVTPGYHEKTVEYCLAKGLPIMPGCVTASDVTLAAEAGLQSLKFFPAEESGGLAAINLLCGPFPGVRFVPTGGIDFGNLPNYMANRHVLACGGSYVAKAALIQKEDWKGIVQNCRRAVDISLGFQLAHVGLNHVSETDAEDAANAFCDIFRLQRVASASSVFAGGFVENMKAIGYGEKGHIGFSTYSMERAVAWLCKRGIPLLAGSEQYDGKGNLSCVYLQYAISGFAVHVSQK